MKFPLILICSYLSVHFIAAEVNSNIPCLINRMLDHNLFKDDETCGQVDVYPDLILKGRKTYPGRWPWMVALYGPNDHGRTVFRCGATLISNKIVVTAAHCVDDTGLKSNQIKLVLGQFNLNTPTKLSRTRLAKKIHFYSKNDDIAIIVLNKPVKYSFFIKPICLWRGSTDINDIAGLKGQVVGWGQIGQKNVFNPEQIVLDVPIVRLDECMFSLPQFRHSVTPTSLCAGSRDGSSPCKGDSGGGLYMLQEDRYSLRGIVSYGASPVTETSCDPAEYVVYTDVAKYLDWIQSFVRYPVEENEIAWV